MLPAPHRLTDSDAFRLTVRTGRRAGTPLLVSHLRVDEAGEQVPVQVGFTVSKAVGNAVVRNRVKRRLRHLARVHVDTLEQLPGRVTWVVRALPASASASSSELGRDMQRSLGRLLGDRVPA